jgi:hypothetical protein
MKNKLYFFKYDDYSCKVTMLFRTGRSTLLLHKRRARILSVTVLSVIVLFSTSAITFFVQNVNAQQQLPDQPDAVINCKPLSITNTTAVLATSNTISIFGIISNINSTEPMNEIRIIGEFYDSSNNLIGVESTFPELAIVPLDQSSPFKILTSITNSTLDHYRLTCGIR